MLPLANTAVFDDVRAVEALVSRLITLGAMGGLGTYYWRIQRNRRRAAGGHGQQMHNAPAGP